MFINKKIGIEGFTLFEVLGVLLILGITLSLTVPKVMATVENAKVNVI